VTASFLTLNTTLVVEVVVFLVVLAVLARFVVKPLQAAMHRRQTEIDETLQKAQRVEDLLAAAQADYDATLAQARREARQIIEAGRRIGTYFQEQRQEAERPKPVSHRRADPPGTASRVNW
jgi:F-type H+-transporting ATPase subunit b